jgi:tetratricopeptide (TPR) repeat protein
MLLKMRDYYDLLTRHQPLLAGSESPGLLGAFYACLGYCDWYFGSYDQSIEDSKRGAKLCEAEGRIEHTGLAYYNLQWSHFQMGKYDQAITFHEEILRKVNEQTDLRDYVMTMASISTVYSWHGRWEEGIEVGQRGLTIAEKYQDKGLISYAALSVSQVYTSKGDLDRGMQYAELAVRNAPTPADKVYAEATLAWTLCRRGEMSRAVEILAPLVATVRAAGYVTPEMLLGLFLAEAYCFAGVNDKATETCERLLYLAERHGARPFAGRAHELLGQVSLETRIGEAAGHFDKAISILQETQTENSLAIACAGMGRYHKQQGNTVEARKYLTKALEIFERLGTLIEPDKVREELSELPQ